LALKFTTAEERLAREQGVNIALFGVFGIGKTWQASTLPPDSTLFLDGEAGMLTLRDWPADSLNIRDFARANKAHPWEAARALACLLSGPQPGASPSDPYGQVAYDAYVKAFGDPDPLFAKYETIFVDSITEFSRHAFSWAQQQPEAFSEKTGKPDNRGAYGLLGREMVKWLSTLQHIRTKNVIVVGGLGEEKDDFGRITWAPMIEGAKAGRELPGIFDCVISLIRLNIDPATKLPVMDNVKGEHKAFVCSQANPFGVPGKTRSGNLGVLEPPNLAALIAKMKNAPRLTQEPVIAPADPDEAQKETSNVA